MIRNNKKENWQWILKREQKYGKQNFDKLLYTEEPKELIKIGSF